VNPVIVTTTGIDARGCDNDGVQRPAGRPRIRDRPADSGTFIVPGGIPVGDWMKGSPASFAAPWFKRLEADPAMTTRAAFM
jgi:hypothetical protein